MAGNTRTRGRSSILHVSLNSDGRSHPLLNALSIFTLIVGIVSFVLGLVIRNVPSTDSLGMAIATTVTGLASLLVGLYAQMISATREERVLIVTGIIAGFVGLVELCSVLTIGAQKGQIMRVFGTAFDPSMSAPWAIAGLLLAIGAFLTHRAIRAFQAEWVVVSESLRRE